MVRAVHGTRRRRRHWRADASDRYEPSDPVSARLREHAEAGRVIQVGRGRWRVTTTDEASL